MMIDTFYECMEDIPISEIVKENVIVFIENQGCMNTEGLYKTLQNEFKLVLT